MRQKTRLLSENASIETQNTEKKMFAKEIAFANKIYQELNEVGQFEVGKFLEPQANYILSLLKLKNRGGAYTKKITAKFDRIALTYIFTLREIHRNEYIPSEEKDSPLKKLFLHFRLDQKFFSEKLDMHPLTFKKKLLCDKFTSEEKFTLSIELQNMVAEISTSIADL
jgi:hypothetical protein